MKRLFSFPDWRTPHTHTQRVDATPDYFRRHAGLMMPNSCRSVPPSVAPVSRCHTSRTSLSRVWNFALRRDFGTVTVSLPHVTVTVVLPEGVDVSYHDADMPDRRYTRTGHHTKGAVSACKGATGPLRCRLWDIHGISHVVRAAGVVIKFRLRPVARRPGALLPFDRVVLVGVGKHRVHKVTQRRVSHGLERLHIIVRTDLRGL
jgi:hypothetical protein